MHVPGVNLTWVDLLSYFLALRVKVFSPSARVFCKADGRTLLLGGHRCWNYCPTSPGSDNRCLAENNPWPSE